MYWNYDSFQSRIVQSDTFYQEVSVIECAEHASRVTRLVHSRLDYYNVVFIGLPARDIQCLQSVLNAAGDSWRDYVTSLLYITWTTSQAANTAAYMLSGQTGSCGFIIKLCVCMYEYKLCVGSLLPVWWCCILSVTSSLQLPERGTHVYKVPDCCHATHQFITRRSCFGSCCAPDDSSRGTFSSIHKFRGHFKKIGVNFFYWFGSRTGELWSQVRCPN